MKSVLPFVLGLGLLPNSNATAQFVDTDPEVCSEVQVRDFVEEQFAELKKLGDVTLKRKWQLPSTTTTGTRYMYKWIATAKGAESGQLCAGCYATYALQEDYMVETTGTYPTGFGYEDCSEYYDTSL